MHLGTRECHLHETELVVYSVGSVSVLFVHSGVGLGRGAVKGSVHKLFACSTGTKRKRIRPLEWRFKRKREEKEEEGEKKLAAAARCLVSK